MPKKHAIVICTIANDRFIEGAIAWAKSVKKNAPNRHAVVIDGGISTINQKRLSAIGVEVTKPDRAIPFDHPRFGPAYALFDIGKLDAEIVMYMDCDTLLVGSIVYLEKIAKKYNIVVSPANSHWKMVEPDYMPYAKGLIENAKDSVKSFMLSEKPNVIGLLDEALNINTGVLCVKTSFMECVTEVAQTYEPIFAELKNPDQELLTLALAEMQVKPALLGWEFNATYIHGTPVSKDGRLRKLSSIEMEDVQLIVSETEVRAFRTPTKKLRAIDKKIEIIHYITSDKPWDADNGMKPEARALWQEYRDIPTVEITRPLISIIVVAYNIENFIEQCLHSCVSDKLSNYEVIVVENKSTDRTLETIKRVQRDYPDVIKVVENDQNYGLGLGRNIGLDHADGLYILFIDGDDWFSPTALDRLGNVISSRDIEVCLFNHSRVYETAYIAPNRLSRLLWEGFRNDPTHRAAVMENLGVAWNKLYKRSFIDEHQLRFGVGFYEDIDWNFSVLLLSEKYYVIPDVLTYYRQRTGSITRSADIRHFDILDQYQRVIAMLKDHPDRRKFYGKAVYRYARGQILNVVHDGGRLPKGSESSYLEKASALLSDFRTILRMKSPILRERAAATGHHKFYMGVHRLFKRINPIERKAIKWVDAKYKVAKRTYRKARGGAFAFGYKHYLTRLPIQDDKVFFEAYWGNKMDCNPYALSLGLSDKGFKCVWSLKDPSKAVRTHDFTTVKRDSWEYWKAIATSKYFVSNVNLGEGLVKRPGQIHVQTWHGTPIKSMGLDIRNYRPREMNWRSFADKCKRWDYTISSNEHSTYAWRRSTPFNYRIIETGYPRNDIFFKDTSDLQTKLRKELGIPVGKKLAMYAPTFRDEAVKKGAKPTKIPFDAKRAQKALGDDWILLMRSHHFSKVRSNKSATESVIDVSDMPNFNELALITDLLITDYSSVMFDYGCRMKPIILFTYDYDKFASDRGVYFDIRDQAPGPVAETMLELEDCLREKRFSSPDSMQKLTAFNAKFCALDDGHATDRVLSEVFGYRDHAKSDDIAQAAE